MEAVYWAMRIRGISGLKTKLALQRILEFRDDKLIHLLNEYEEMYGLFIESLQLRFRISVSNDTFHEMLYNDFGWQYINVEFKWQTVFETIWACYSSITRTKTKELIETEIRLYGYGDELRELLLMIDEIPAKHITQQDWLTLRYIFAADNIIRKYNYVEDTSTPNLHILFQDDPLILQTYIKTRLRLLNFEYYNDRVHLSTLFQDKINSNIHDP